MFWRAKKSPRKQLSNRRLHRWSTANARVADFEQLEQRKVLTTLTILGTSGNDAISLVATPDGSKVQVTVNKTVTTYALGPVTSIQVSGLDGNDWITVKGIDKPVFVDGGTGTNELSIVGHAAANAFSLDTASVLVNTNTYSYINTQLLTVTGQNANDTFTVVNYPAITTTIDGAGGGNTLVGTNANTTWNIQVANGGMLNSMFHFGNIQNLTGGSGDDSFVFSPGKYISATINGGTGANNLDFSSFTTPLSVNLQSQAATAVGHFTNIATVTGGSAKDTLIGANLSNNWDINGFNDITVGGIDFSSFENLIGGSQTDNFQFADGAIVTGKVDGGLGSNKIDLSSYTSDTTISLLSNTISGLTTESFARIQTFVGSTTANTTLSGTNSNATWNITAKNAGNVSGIFFTNVDNLTGGTGADTFLFSNGAGVTGAIDGGAGTDILKYTSYTTPITVDLTANTATGNTITAKIANLEGVIGGSSPGVSNTLIGPDLGAGSANANAWTITANNVGNVNGFTFSGFENLTGGPHNDDFAFSNGKGVSGIIDGGDSGDPTIFNTLDYSAYTTAITVDLSTGKATNIFGGTAGGVTNITDILGGSGNDTLTGNSLGNLIWGNGGNDIINGGGGNDILVGGAGNDMITSTGTGRSLIMGGDGRDTLIGGSGQDILINGTTSFDTDGATQDTILTFWTDTTTPLPFATRVSEMRAGTTGVTGMPTFDSTNIFNDNFVDSMTGGVGGQEWFWAKVSGSNQDIITDFAAGDALN